MVRIYVPDIPEFSPLITAVQQKGECEVVPPRDGYWRIESSTGLRFERKELGLGPALWNSALTGGFRGRIVQYDRNVMKIEGEAPAG